MFLPPAGHCFPSNRSGTGSAGTFSCPWIGVAAYDWGREVVRFFERNRCAAQLSPTPPPPTPPPVLDSGEQDLTPMPTAPPETAPPTSPVASFSREDGGTLQYYSDEDCNTAATMASTTITSVPGGRCAARAGSVPWPSLTFFSMGIACQENARSDEVLICFGPTADQCACEVVSQRVCLELGEQYVKIICNVGNGGRASSCQEAWTAGNGGRFIIAASGAAGCGPCGHRIETYEDCMTVSEPC